MFKYQYVADVKSLSKALQADDELKRNFGSKPLSVVKLGLLRSICCFGKPLLSIQHNPNFKNKVFLGYWPLFTWKRQPNSAFNLKKILEKSNRKNRIYINVGSLPYFDNRSGIPRVAKELTKYGLLNQEVDVLPVYCNPRTGLYHFANCWSLKEGFLSDCRFELNIDPVAQFQKGDWLIHTMINVGEIRFSSNLFRVLRERGIRIGFVLHDIIAERSPQFFKRRDARNFSKWLRELHLYDGIFAISRSTLDDYSGWLQNHVPNRESVPLGFFHLGANFSQSDKAFSVDETYLLKPLKKDSFYVQVSTIEPRKGYQQLVDAFEQLWAQGFNQKLVLVGRQGWMVNDLCRHIRQHKEYNRRLFWFNKASDLVVKWLYQNARGVIFASENEGFGLACVEGAYYRKPVLVRDIPVFREVAGNQAFYFKGSSPQCLAEGVLKVEEALSTGFKPEQISYLTWKESTERFLSLVKDFSNGNQN